MRKAKRLITVNKLDLLVLSSAMPKNRNFHGTVESFIPEGKIGWPEGLKGTAVFLASKASDYLMGSVIVIDGSYISR